MSRTFMGRINKTNKGHITPSEEWVKHALVSRHSKHSTFKWSLWSKKELTVNKFLVLSFKSCFLFTQPWNSCKCSICSLIPCFSLCWYSGEPPENGLSLFSLVLMIITCARKRAEWSFLIISFPGGLLSGQVLMTGHTFLLCTRKTDVRLWSFCHRTHLNSVQWSQRVITP